LYSKLLSFEYDWWIIVSIQSARYIIPFDEITLADHSTVGGKNASLGELIQGLTAIGVNVPDGFAITTQAYHEHLRQNNLEKSIYSALDSLDVHLIDELTRVASKIRQQIYDAQLPDPIRTSIIETYRRVLGNTECDSVAVAVRSSATAEDLPSASFAGQQESYLFVQGIKQLDDAVRSCMASLFTDRAIVYRVQQGIHHRDVALSIGIQRMVRSDLASAGVIFTIDTESGFKNVVQISGAWGLGELLVKGRVNPDEFMVHKPTAQAGYRSIIRKSLGSKKNKLVRNPEGNPPTTQVDVAIPDQNRFVLTDDEILKLSGWAMDIEDHYTKVSGKPTPMDLEWAKDGITDELYIVQARPETVHSQSDQCLKLFHLGAHGSPILSGKSVGQSISSGPVRVIQSDVDLHAFKDGEVIVANMTDPDWNPVLKRASAVITDHGGRTCHAAIVARELGIPCVVGTSRSTTDLRDGQMITISCAQGETGYVYDGELEFTVEKVDPESLPTPPVPLMLNIASPEMAFHHAMLPSTGVGLMRTEFLITDWIGIHPMALVHPQRVKSQRDIDKINERSHAHSSPAEYFIDRLATGIAQIAAAFYPRPVTVRFSDFKTNEYAGLIGGESFEPIEANPMLGFRGASRYYDDRYREGFALECKAIRRVRETMGLTNVKLMIPFCRTIEEGRRVFDEMKINGLEQGKDNLEIYVMCEIPNNVILAKEFSELFDGFSIGSNDLTQLALGIDRDSDLLEHLFDERDLGVKKMISMVIDAAHQCGRPVGICGQAPSDFPEFAEFLVKTGIDMISLNPDSLLTTIQHISSEPKIFSP
jgi:pyruvate, water dikinase